MNNLDKLIELLELKNFEGMDVSIEESLLGYGIVCRQSDGFTILCNTEEPYNFGNTTINIDNIEDAINDMKDGFFSYIGMNKEEYIKSFNKAIKSKNNLCRFIYDIRSYDDRLTYDIYTTLTIDQMINILEHI